MYLCRQKIVKKMDYKTSYTKEEMDELADWFEANLERMPASLKINEFMKVDDLPFTVKQVVENLRKGQGSIAFSGQVHQFYLLRDAIEKVLK